jgi:hypothetical protein
MHRIYTTVVGGVFNADPCITMGACTEHQSVPMCLFSIMKSFSYAPVHAVTIWKGHTKGPDCCSDGAQKPCTITSSTNLSPVGWFFSKLKTNVRCIFINNFIDCFCNQISAWTHMLLETKKRKQNAMSQKTKQYFLMGTLSFLFKTPTILLRNQLNDVL